MGGEEEGEKRGSGEQSFCFHGDQQLQSHWRGGSDAPLRKMLGTSGLTAGSGPPSSRWSSPEGSILLHPGGWELPSAPAAPADPWVTTAHPLP